MSASWVYIVIFEDIGSNGERTLTAFADKDKALADIKWYREQYLVPELRDMSADDKAQNELMGDLIDEPEYIYLVDTVRVQLDKVPYFGGDE